MDKNDLYVKKNTNYKTVNIILLLLSLVFVSFVSIGYSAINANLMISGDLQFYPIKDLYDLIAKSSKGLDTNINFGVAPTEATSGVYKMNSTNSDKYPVYYYRGIVSNNNVKFASFCWKMVRTTSTGGVKLIYNGVPASDGSCNNKRTASQIGGSTFNNSYDDSKYVGYTYDTNTDSTIKAYIDDWYSKNMTSYTGMLEDTIWCNDRSIYSQNGNNIDYGAYGRLKSFKPSIICPNTSDKYTVSSSNGNGLLKYPVALLTADELTLAGHGYQGYTQSGYLTAEIYWWSLSPDSFVSNGGAYESHVRSSGILDISRVSNSGGVRPALSLKPGTTVNGGDGTVSNPYQIMIS